MQILVDLSRLRHNVRTIRSLTKKPFCAVAKSNAYGHGAAVAKYIEPLSDCFFVATHDEARELFYLGIRRPIMVLGGEISPYLREVNSLIIPTVCDARQLTALLGAGYRNFSIAVNTGMNRLGANRTELEKIVDVCVETNSAPFSIYSHIYGGVGSAYCQSEEFRRMTDNLPFETKRHLYSSCALDLIDYDLFDMTRMGLAMYGYGRFVEPCMKARAPIVAISAVKKGEHVGYGDVVLERDSLVATVRCGYADGFHRCERPLYIKVRGKKCPVIGQPCMDLTMIDVSDVRCRVGEYAYVIADKEDALYLAKCYDTILYEVLTGFNGRAERIYM